MPADWAADPSATGGGGPAANPQLAAVEAAVAEFQRCAPASRDPRSLADDVVRIERLLARLGACQVACVRVMQERGDAEVLGARSTQAWLRRIARLAPGAAKALVALAGRMDMCPGTESALGDGLIGMRHAEVLARTIHEIAPHLADPAAVASVEKELVDLAERLDPLRLADACRRLRIAAAPDPAGKDWAAVEQRRLSISRTFAGLAAVDGVLDPVSAETVMCAIHAFSAPGGRDDDRTPGQRRADALTEICRRVLALGNPPVTGGERPHLLVMIPLDTLTGRRNLIETPGGNPGPDQRPDGGPPSAPGAHCETYADSNMSKRTPRSTNDSTNDLTSGELSELASVADAPGVGGVGELSWAGPISAELVRQIACDATVTRVVLAAASQPLDVGRSTRVVPAALRKALVLRDRTCRYPGCDVPAVWCDAHHVRHWARGGVTALHNLILLCGYHHARLHLTGEWIMLRPDGAVRIIRDPDPDHHGRDGPGE